jgi:hypothetical protein
MEGWTEEKDEERYSASFERRRALGPEGQRWTF